MKIIELIRRDDGDPIKYMIHMSHKLVSRTIEESNLLHERFNDNRTVYEQYSAGEKYLKYDDELLYSRAAYEYMFNKVSNSIFMKKNFDFHL